jgi:ribosomal protein S18 acetylase RimI-like enzyme
VVRIRPLSEVPVRELRPLLDEEAAYWGGELLWDYADVSMAVASGLERGSLRGRVLEDDRRTVAYCYYLHEGGRAIVGSLFAAAGFRGQGIEEQLLDGVLADAQALPDNDRIECQTLFSTAPGADARFASAGFLGRPRHYLIRSLAQPAARATSRPRLRPVGRDDIPLAAEIVYRSHRGSLDAALNLTYATPASCRGFVETLMLRAGCGQFDSEASFLAETRDGGVGVVLASRLSGRNGHICQVSVLPQCQASGLGTALMAAALEGFRRGGLSTASLSVTVGNGRAYRLYERLGFGLKKAFAAHAWLRPPARIDLPA